MKARTILAATVGLIAPGVEAGAQEITVKSDTQLRVTAGQATEIPGAVKLVRVAGTVRLGVVAEGRLVASDSSLVAVQLPGGAPPIALPRPGARLVGRLVSMDDEMLTIRFDGHKQAFRVPRDVIAGVEMKQPGGRQFGRRLATGLGTGVLAGLVLGLASGDDERGFMRFTAGEKALIYGTMLGLVGGVAGAIAGLSGPPARWEPVELASGHVRLGFEPRTRGGIGVGLSVSF